MQFIKLVAERELGKGWVRLVLKAESAPPLLIRYSFEQKGYREPYLGENGWQVATYFFETEGSWDEARREFSFLIKPQSVQHMRTGSNYELSLLDPRGALTVMCVVPWRGVPSFMLPKNSHAVLEQAVTPEVPAVPEVPKAPSPVQRAAASPPTSVIAPQASVDTVWSVSPSLEDEREGSAKHSMNSEMDSSRTVWQPFPSIDVSDSPAPALTDVSNAQAGASALLTDVQSPAPAVADAPKPFKVDCPHGNHKILSNMVFCPICSKPV